MKLIYFFKLSYIRNSFADVVLFASQSLVKCEICKRGTNRCTSGLLTLNFLHCVSEAVSHSLGVVCCSSLSCFLAESHILSPYHLRPRFDSARCLCIYRRATLNILLHNSAADDLAYFMTAVARWRSSLSLFQRGCNRPTRRPATIL